MFLDIGFPELMMLAFVGLLVIGPERLPETLRTLGLWFGRLRRSFVSVKAEIEREIGMDDIKRQLHNESVMEEMRRIEREVNNSIQPEANSAPASNPQDPSTPAAASPAEEISAPAEAPPPPVDTPRPASEAELEAQHQAAAARQARQSDSSS